VGTISLLACAFVKSQGASRIVAIDINQSRLHFAKSYGFASQVFAVPAVDRAKTTEDQLRQAREHIQAALAKFGKPEGFFRMHGHTTMYSNVNSRKSNAPPSSPYAITVPPVCGADKRL